MPLNFDAWMPALPCAAVTARYTPGPRELDWVTRPGGSSLPLAEPDNGCRIDYPVELD